MFLVVTESIRVSIGAFFLLRDLLLIFTSCRGGFRSGSRWPVCFFRKPVKIPPGKRTPTHTTTGSKQ